MSDFMTGLRNIGPGRLSAIGGIMVLFGAFFIFLFVRLSSPILVPLYSDLSPSEIDKVSIELSRMQYEYRLRSGDSAVLVPISLVPEIRLALAERGLPSKTDLGNELFDREQGIGTSTFVQEINRKRALEGELARTVSSLDTVQGARVHLVLPERKLFSREEGQARASVVLRMRGAYRLDRKQIAAVQHLISSSVPDLSPRRVSIIDERGVLLAMGDDSSGGMDTIETLRIEHEDRLKQSIEDLLYSTVGFGKARAEVNVEMDHARVQVEQESFDPNLTALRSSEAIEETTRNVNLEPDEVSAAINIPGEADIDNRVGSQENMARTEQRNNFEVPKITRIEQLEPGRIKRISVAVLVDGSYITDAEGNMIYQARTEREIADLEELVRSAIGFEAERQDNVRVINMRFADPVVDPESIPNRIFGFETQEISRLFEAGLLVIFGLLVILLLVRPLLQRIFLAAPQAVAIASGESSEEYMRALESGDLDALPLSDRLSLPSAMMAGAPGAVNRSGVPGVAGAIAEGAAASGQNLNSGVDTRKAEDQLLEDIGRIIDERPEDAVAVIRHWIYESPSET